MRSKKRNTNIKILQSQLQNLDVKDVKPIEIKSTEIKGTGVIELPINESIPKKRGIPKNELINTKRLLT
jgi:hypothetical protein